MTVHRYADVVVHRLLAASLGLISLPESLHDRARMTEVVDNMNERHHNAQMAGRSSAQLHTVVFFRDTTIVADARVIRPKANGLIVFVPKFGIEGAVYFDAAPRGGKRAAASAPVDSGCTLNEAEQVRSRRGKTFTKTVLVCWYCTKVLHWLLHW